MTTVDNLHPLAFEFECAVGGAPKEELFARFKNEGVLPHPWTKQVMSHPSWRPGEREVARFAKVRIRSLGFRNKPKTYALHERIAELGHSLCQPGDAPAIALSSHIATPEIVWFAMEPVKDFDENPGVFYFSSFKEPKQLNVAWVYPQEEWGLDVKIVFRV